MELPELEWYKVGGTQQSGIPIPNWGYYKQSGLYFIRENDVLVYLGMSSVNIFRRCLHHFQNGGHRQVKFKRTQHTYTMAFILTDNGNEAEELEMLLLRELKPRDNINYYIDMPERPDFVIDEQCPY